MTRLVALMSMVPALASCESGEETSVDVWIESDAALLTGASTLRVVVRGTPTGPSLTDASFALSELSFPVRVHLVPEAGAPGRSWAIEAFLDAAGATPVARVAAHGDYVDGRALEVRLRFEAGCDAGRSCVAGEACRAGVCLDACLVPQSEGGRGTPCALLDAGVRDGGAVEAGTDAGAPPDAGDIDAGDIDAGDIDAGRVDAGRVDAGRVDAGRVDAGRSDASVDGGTPHIPVYVVRELASRTISSATFTSISTMPLPSRAHRWLLLVSARLDATPATAERGIELEYQVDGVTRGAGTSVASASGGDGGPFVHFDVVPSGAAHTVTVRARSATSSGVVRDLRVVALPLVEAGILAFADDGNTVVSFNAVAADLAALSFASTSDVLVLGATMAGADGGAPAGRGFPSTIRLEVGALSLPPASRPGSFLSTGQVRESPAIVLASYTRAFGTTRAAMVGQSSSGAASAQHSRVLALDPARAFATFDASAPADRSVPAGATQTLATLTTTSRGAGIHDTVWLSFVGAWTTVGPRQLRFGPGTLGFSHALSDGAARLIYARAGAQSEEGTSTFDISATAGTTELFTQRATIFAIGLE